MALGNYYVAFDVQNGGPGFEGLTTKVLKGKLLGETVYISKLVKVEAESEEEAVKIATKGYGSAAGKTFGVTEANFKEYNV